MRVDASSPGRAELGAARADSRALLASVIVFSAAVNLLLLTGPLFMLQVYDRVLVSRSQETLLALFLLVILMFGAMGLLDDLRGRVMRRMSARFQSQIEARVFAAALQRAAIKSDDPCAATALRDLDSVGRLLGAPVFFALFDIPWSVMFFGAIFVFHNWLGLLAIAGGAILIGVTLLNQALTAEKTLLASAAQILAERLADQLRNEAEAIQSLGMRSAAFRRWCDARKRAGAATLTSADLGSSFLGFIRTFRLFLQSAMLALGAWVVLRGEMSGGAMIAGSILMGRALTPIELAVNGWPIVIRGRQGWQRLSQLLSSVPPEQDLTPLPRPRARLKAHALTMVPPGGQSATLHGVSFALTSGQALGVIGPSGAGKSTLARLLCGLWPPTAGMIRLDGAPLDQFSPDVLGGLIGYLPQRVTLFDGTIAENIARLAPQPDPAQIISAAQRAGAHQMILDLPDGYDTRVTQSGGSLSGGQIQRIGLARAFYGNPVLLVLDEPNASLDNAGSVALNLAIRTMKAAGGAVIIMTHRPAAIAECDMLLVLEDGRRRAYGPRDEVLRSLVRNTAQIGNTSGSGGGT